MQESTVAYIAGLLDGEGTIGLVWNRSKGRWRANTNHLRAQVDIVANCDERLIRFVVDTLKEWGLSPKTVDYRTEQRNPNWNAAWKVFLVTIDDKKKFLELIRPYLVAKQEQADIVLKFLSRRGSHTKVKTTQYERLLWAACAKLNKRGRAPEPVTTGREAGDTPKLQSELYGDIQSEAEMTSPATDKIQ
jgi:hypothetical protein